MDSYVPDEAKELRQPAGIETNEVGRTRGDPRRDEGMVEAIAIICHETNRAYCAVVMGDHSQSEWNTAPMWQRESARLGVKKILAGEITHPEQSHESWYAQKQAEGWVYGPVKIPETKEHPCMVPYAQLPAAQRMKDHLFFAVAYTLSTDIG